VTKGRGSGQPAPVDFLLWPAHVSVASLVLLTMSFAVFPVFFSPFRLCSGSFRLFVHRVVFSRLALPCSSTCIRCFMRGCMCSCSGTSCSCWGTGCSCWGTGCSFSGTGCRCFSAFVWGYFRGCCCRARARVFADTSAVESPRARVPAAGASTPLFGVILAAVAAVLVFVHLMLYGRLHMLVLGHGLGVLLCLCLGCFLRLLLPCSCWCLRCCMGGCTCSCSYTGWGCFSAFVWGGFLRLLLPCACLCIRCFMGGCTCSCLGTGRLWSSEI